MNSMGQPVGPNVTSALPPPYNSSRSNENNPYFGPHDRHQVVPVSKEMVAHEVASLIRVLEEMQRAQWMAEEEERNRRMLASEIDTLVNELQHRLAQQ